MDLGLAGKVAIITGGSKGLGLAAASALVAEGARVAICGRTPATLDEGGTRHSLRKSGAPTTCSP